MATFERLAIYVEANASKAIAEFKQVGLAAKKLEGNATGAGKSVGLLGRLSGQSGALLKAGMVAGIAGAGVAIAKFAGDSIDAFTSLAGQVKQFQRITLTTAEDASRLVSTFRALNIDVEAGGTFFGRFAKNLGTGSQALKDVGITAVRTKSGNIDMAQSFLGVVDAYNATSNAGQRAAIGNAAFGRGWITLAPILARGREGVEDLYAEAEKHGLILSEDDLAKAAELKIAMRDLKGAVEGLEVAAGKTLVPFLTKVAGLIGDTLHGIEVLAHPPTPEQDDSKWADFARGYHLVDNWLGHLVTGNHAVAESAKDAGVNEQVLGDAVTDLSKSVVTAVDADRALADADRSLKSARRGLADANADLNTLLKTGAVDLEKVADATRSLDDATRSLHHAQREQTKSQEAYNKALANYQLTGTDTNAETLADASDNLADANDSVASATADAAKAAGELKAAQAGDPEFQDKLAAARDRVGDAQDHVNEAEYTYSQKSGAAIAANEEVGVAINLHADAVERLRNLLTDQVFQHPELAAFLNPQIAELGSHPPVPAVAPPIAGPVGMAPPAPGDNDPQHWADWQKSWGDEPSGFSLTAPTAPTTTTNNVTINATASPADARLIAKEVMWNLN